MTAAALAESRPRPSRRWWGLVVLVFVVQVGLVFWLSDRTPPRPPRPAAAPALQLLPVKATFELLALGDPTLFALPHRQGFSGPAWLEVPPLPLQSFVWSEPPRWLPPPLADLGLAFGHFIETNDFNALPAPAQPRPDLALPAVAPLSLSREHSEVRIEGALAQRHLIGSLELPAWPNPDLLTDTVVQLAVDDAGRPLSFTMLPPGSGSRKADQFALDLARTARFEPISGDSREGPRPQATRLTWGLMVFQWHTLPMPATNAPTAGP